MSVTGKYYRVELHLGIDTKFRCDAFIVEKVTKHAYQSILLALQTMYESI